MAADSNQSEAAASVPPAWLSGDLGADLYRELRAAARALLARQPVHGSLPGTALVHEAWLRLKHSERRDWATQADFCAAVVQAVRHILIDHCRRSSARKRRADGRRVLFDSGVLAIPKPQIDLVELNDALERLAALDPLRARVVELLFFGGLTTAQAADALGVSVRSVQLYWRTARAWLRREFSRSHSEAEPS